ncbi:hypothetical protein FACS1894206_10230 [Deltaproteobacteria bacterium]|nr:hypothetical protein FACS1894206_10230 [Deltaproteobacteria bacterium]
MIGVWRREGGERKPDFRTLAVFSLTPESHGNSMGMGMVDIIPASFRDGIDFNATYMNALTSGIWRAARMPVVMPTEQYIVEKLFSKIPEDRKPRAARVRSTLHLEEFWVSEAVAAELQENKTVDVKGKTSQWDFTAEGKLLPFSAS